MKMIRLSTPLQIRTDLVKKLRRETIETIAILSIGLLLALLIRYLLKGFITLDTKYAIVPWYQIIQREGLASFSKNFSNYPPLYLYSLYITTKVFPGLSALSSIKIFPVISDFVCAYFAFRIVQHIRASQTAGLLTLFAILFAPTVVMNSSLWGQIDMMYVCFLVGSLFLIIKHKNTWACIFFGLAFSIKFQAIFLAPLYVLLCLKGRVSIKNLLWIPAVYLLTILPNWILGRPLIDLLTIYFGQVQQFQELTSNFPNLYAWLPNAYFNLFLRAGIIWAVALTFLYLLIGYKSPKTLDAPILIELALLSSVLLTYSLPLMHDRYGFISDVISILYFFVFPRRVYLPVTINLLSFFAYYPFLFRGELFPLPVLAIFSTGALCLLVYHTLMDLYPSLKQQLFPEQVETA